MSDDRHRAMGPQHLVPTGDRVHEPCATLDFGEPSMVFHPLWDKSRARVTAVDLTVRFPGISDERWPWETCAAFAHSNTAWRDVDRLVLERSIDAAAWIRSQVGPRSTAKIGLRLSAASLMQHDLVDVISAGLGARGLTTESVYFQLCEHQVPADFRLGRWMLARLDSMGVTLAVDALSGSESSTETVGQLPIRQVHLRSKDTQAGVEAFESLLQPVLPFEVGRVIHDIDTPARLGDALRLGAGLLEGSLLSEPLSLDGLTEQLSLQTEHPGLLAARRALFLSECLD